MNLSIEPSIYADMRQCAHTFEEVDTQVRSGKVCFVQCQKGRFSCATARGASDRVIVQKVTSLLQRAVASRDYTPDNTVVPMLRRCVKNFIARSSEFSEEALNNEEGLDIACAYTTEFLLGQLLNEKIIAKAAEEEMRTRVSPLSPSVEELINRKHTSFDAGRFKQLAQARNILYLSQKFLLHLAERYRVEMAYLTNYVELNKKIKYTTKKAPPGDALFYLEADAKEILGDATCLAVRMKLARLIETTRPGKCNEDILRNVIMMVVRMRAQDPSKTEFVNDCLAFLRCWNFNYGDRQVKGRQDLDRELNRWDEVATSVLEDENLHDAVAIDALVDCIAAKHIMATMFLLDGYFIRKQNEYFAAGCERKVVDVIPFQQSQGAFMWSFTKNLVERYLARSEHEGQLYEKITRTMQAMVRLLPRDTQHTVTSKIISKFTIHETSRVHGTEREIVLSDLTSQQYQDRARAIASTRGPIITKVDDLVHLVEMLLQQERQEEQAKETEAMRCSLKKLALANNKAASPKKKTPTKQRPYNDQKGTGKTAPTVQVSPPSSLKQPSPFFYHTRVARWWSSDPAIDPFLNDPDYREGGFSDHAKCWIRTAHNFAICIDHVATQVGIRHGAELALVGEITMDGETQRGVFLYVFDAKGRCYHRFFTKKSVNYLIDEYAKQGFYTLDFPPLQEKFEEAPSMLCQDGSTIERTSEHTIIVNDPKNHAVITLCSVNN